MAMLITRTKLWPSGTEIAGSSPHGNVNNWEDPATKFVADDKGHLFEFLFWNTGRHLTRKRHVQWTFHESSSVWTATKWYGTPGDGTGVPHVHVDGFNMGDDAVLGPATAIDGPNSTYPTGAFPFNGNDDHEIGTAGGNVEVAAKDPGFGLPFAGWLSLVFGGDDTGIFSENDDDDSPPPTSDPYLFEHSTGKFAAAQGSSYQLLAAYGEEKRRSLVFDLPEFFSKGGPIPIGDSANLLNVFRSIFIDGLIRQSAPLAQQATVDAQTLIAQAPAMALEDLKSARTSLLTSLDLGQTALSTIESQLKRRGGKE